MNQNYLKITFSIWALMYTGLFFFFQIQLNANMNIELYAMYVVVLNVLYTVTH